MNNLKELVLSFYDVVPGIELMLLGLAAAPLFAEPSLWPQNCFKPFPTYTYFSLGLPTLHSLHLKAPSKTGIVCRKYCRARKQHGLRDGFCMAGLALCMKSWLACRRNTWRLSVQKARVKDLGSLDFFWRWKKLGTVLMLSNETYCLF